MHKRKIVNKKTAILEQTIIIEAVIAFLKKQKKWLEYKPFKSLCSSHQSLFFLKIISIDNGRERVKNKFTVLIREIWS